MISGGPLPNLEDLLIRKQRHGRKVTFTATFLDTHHFSLFMQISHRSNSRLLVVSG